MRLQPAAIAYGTGGRPPTMAVDQYRSIIHAGAVHHHPAASQMSVMSGGAVCGVNMTGGDVLMPPLQHHHNVDGHSNNVRFL